MLRRLLKKHALQRRIPVDQLPESQLPFPEVVRVLKAFSVGYPEQKIALNIRCKSGDASIRELRGSVVLPVSFLKTKTLVFATV
jgi:hypothetical protein